LDRQGFCFQFCDVAKLTDHHPQEDLATFGYQPDVKVKKFEEYFGCLLEPVVEIWLLLLLLFL
jgi:hypothetical protein